MHRSQDRQAQPAAQPSRDPRAAHGAAAAATNCADAGPGYAGTGAVDSAAGRRGAATPAAHTAADNDADSPAGYRPLAATTDPAHLATAGERAGARARQGECAERRAGCE